MRVGKLNQNKLGKLARTPGFLIYMGGYAALLAWFKLVDVYHAHFASKGLIVVAYNVFRVLFIFYLFWIVYAAGAIGAAPALASSPRAANRSNALCWDFSPAQAYGTSHCSRSATSIYIPFRSLSRSQSQR